MRVLGRRDYAFRKRRGKRLCRPDFLEQNALLWANVKPDEKGIASIDLKGLSDTNAFTQFAVDV